MKNSKSTLYLAAGLSGFIAAILYSPNKGSINRLKAKKGINRLAKKALAEVESAQEALLAE